MARAALLLVALLGLCISQVLAARNDKKMKCYRDYGVEERTWDVIKEMKEQMTGKSMDSEDNCALEKDELLSYALAVAQRATMGSRRKRKVVNFDVLHPEAFWDEDVITYAKDEDFDEEEQDNIDIAMDYLSSQTCFDVEPVDVEDEALVYFAKDASCLTFMGKVPDEDLPHKIYLNSECTNRAGEVLHYIMHMLGFWHEQQRPDRDDFITIMNDEVISGEEGNFFKVSDDLLDTLGTPYDYTSIMHQKSTVFATSDGYTMEPKLAEGDEQLRPHLMRTMGQRVGLSFFDRKQINLVYCSYECEDFDNNCENGGYLNPRNCDECVCPDGFGGDFCDSVGYYDEEGDCGGQLTAGDSVQFVTSPGYGTGSYDVGLTCAWSIEAPEGKQVALEFQDEFGVFCRGSDETCYNWVEIHLAEHPDGLTQPTTRFCCDSTPEVKLVTSKALVVFKSNYPSDAADRVGFKLAFSIEGAEIPECPCENGGECLGEGEDFYCDCPDGFLGETCGFGCGTCPMPARSVDQQEASPCEGYRETTARVCVTKKVSYSSGGRGWWRRRRTKWKTVTTCHMAEDNKVGPYCGCGYELYDDGDDMSCAMTGWGEWEPECECHSGSCKQARNYFSVTGGHTFAKLWWCGEGYYLGATGYRDCPVDDGCDDSCEDGHGHHSGWSWWRRR